MSKNRSHTEFLEKEKKKKEGDLDAHVTKASGKETVSQQVLFRNKQLQRRFHS